MFNKIEKETWVRKEHFNYFSTQARNSFNLTKKIEATKVLEVKNQYDLSFYGIMLYVLTKTANDIPELRMGYHKGVLGYWDDVHPSYTIFNEKTKTFSNIWTPYQEDLLAFVKSMQEDKSRYKNQTSLFPQKNYVENTLTISCLPWLDYDSFSIEVEDQSFYSPIITFSKYVIEGEQVVLKVSLRCHHAVADGYHASLFFETLEKYITTLGK